VQFEGVLLQCLEGSIHQRRLVAVLNQREKSKVFSLGCNSIACSRCAVYHQTCISGDGQSNYRESRGRRFYFFELGPFTRSLSLSAQIINAGDKYHRFVRNSPAGQMGVPFKAGPTEKNQDSRIKNDQNYPVEPRQIEMESFAA
jgi:hypothetical protein